MRKLDEARQCLAEGPQTKLTVPTIHMNGSSKSMLLTALKDAYRAVNAATKALREAAPNGRDYYVQGPTAVEKATQEHRDRARRLQSVADELRDIALAVQRQ